MDPIYTYITISYVATLVSYILMCLFYDPPESDDETWVASLIITLSPISLPVLCSYGITRGIASICNYLNAD